MQLDRIEKRLIITAIAKHPNNKHLVNLEPDDFSNFRNYELMQCVPLLQNANLEEFLTIARINANLTDAEEEYLRFLQPFQNLNESFQIAKALKEARARKEIEAEFKRFEQHSNRMPIRQIADRLEYLQKLCLRVDTVEGSKTLAEQAYSLIETFTSSGLKKYKTGFAQLDKFLKVIYQGQYVLIGARPSVGKTSLALQMSYKFAEQNIKTAIYSLEMHSWQLLVRFASFQFGTDFNETVEKFTENPKLVEKLKYLDRILINDTVKPTIDAIVTTIEEDARKHGIEVFFVDYLQLINADKSLSSEQFFAQCSQKLKTLCKEKQLTGFILSQLNRQPEQRKGEVKLADLRYSGALEQDADVVIMISNVEGVENGRQIAIAKNRNGPCGIFRTFFDPKRFSLELEKHFDEEEEEFNYKPQENFSHDEEVEAFKTRLFSKLETL